MKTTGLAVLFGIWAGLATAAMVKWKDRYEVVENQLRTLNCQCHPERCTPTGAAP